MMNQTITNDNHGFSSLEEGFLSVFATLIISCGCAGIRYLMKEREPRNNQPNQPIASIVIDREQVRENPQIVIEQPRNEEGNPQVVSARPSNSLESPRAIEMSVRAPAAHLLQ